MGFVDGFLSVFAPKPMDDAWLQAHAAIFARLQDEMTLQTASYWLFEKAVQTPGVLPQGWTCWTNQQQDTEHWSAPSRQHGGMHLKLYRDGVLVVAANDWYRYRLRIEVFGSDAADTQALTATVARIAREAEHNWNLRHR